MSAAGGTLAFVGRFWGPLFTDEPIDVIFGTGPGIPGVGDAGAATFVLDLEQGVQLTLEWKTGIFKSEQGKERRSAQLDAPKMMIAGQAFIVGDQVRATRGLLARYAALGRPFLLGLPYEELTLTADADSNTVFVADTSFADWLQNPGQRCVIVDNDRNSIDVIVQDWSETEIILDKAPGSIGRKNGRIMPCLGVFLDAEQSFQRYPSNPDAEDGVDILEQWNITARAIDFGFARALTMGVGVELTTHGPPNSLNPALTNKVVFDRQIDVDGSVADSMHALTTIVDLGGIPFSFGNGTIPDWGRALALVDQEIEQFQWLKAFLFFCCGAQRSFWLPTWRADLIAVDVLDGLPATKAQLDFSAPLTASGALEGLVIQAKVAGASGNDISVTMREGPYALHGEIAETSSSITISFNEGGTTSTDIEALLATSILVDVVSPSENEGDFLSAADDQFVGANLIGGEDAVSQRLVVRSEAGKGDFFAWFPQLRTDIQLQFEDDSIVYAKILSAEDNFDGTVTLSLDRELPPDLEILMISWLDLCRLERDTVVITIGDTFSMSETARAVQR